MNEPVGLGSAGRLPYVQLSTTTTSANAPTTNSSILRIEILLRTTHSVSDSGCAPRSGDAGRAHSARACELSLEYAGCGSGAGEGRNTLACCATLAATTAAGTTVRSAAPAGRSNSPAPPASRRRDTFDRLHAS